MEPKRLPPGFRFSALGDQRIARHRPYSLSQSVGRSPDKHDPPGVCERQERLPCHRCSIADDGKRFFSPALVDKPAGKDLHKSRDALCDPLDQTQGGGRCSECRDQEERNDGVRHLARDVREERRETEKDDVCHAAPGRVEGKPGALRVQCRFIRRMLPQRVFPER